MSGKFERLELHSDGVHLAARWASDRVEWADLRALRLVEPTVLAFETADRALLLTVEPTELEELVSRIVARRASERRGGPVQGVINTWQPAGSEEPLGRRDVVLGCGLFAALTTILCCGALALRPEPSLVIVCASAAVALAALLVASRNRPRTAAKFACSAFGLQVRVRDREQVLSVPWTEVAGIACHGHNVVVERRHGEALTIRATPWMLTLAAQARDWLAAMDSLEVDLDVSVPSAALSRAQAPDADAERGLSVTGGGDALR